MVYVFTDKNFQKEVLESDIPVLVDFWAAWCRPCHVLSPTIDRLYDLFNGHAKIGKVNIDENQVISKQEKISAVPTVILYNNGAELKRLVGVQSEDALKEALSLCQ